MTIYIIDPRNGHLRTIDQWRKEPDPTIAELVCITGGIAGPIAIHKYIISDGNFGPKRFTWDEARRFVERYRISSKVLNDNVAPFSLPTRHDCIDIYDARFSGLDEALALIGGDHFKDYLIWTGDEEPDPEYKSYNAFIFSGTYGGVNYDSKCTTHAVRPVVYIDPFQI